MRGFQVPARPEDYWECARIMSQGDHNTSTFLEWILLGPDRNVQLHLLIPTQFGIYLNSARSKKILSVISNHPDKAGILIRQHDCINQCVKCNNILQEDENKPRQVVLRVASGQTLHDEWNYDFLMCFFCFDCQTTKTCNLIKTSDAMFDSFNVAVARYGFADAFAPLTKRHDLMDSYLERFVLLNEYTPSLLEESMHLSKYCYHCGAQVKKLKACEACCIMYYCKKGSCIQKAMDNHHQNHECLALREKHLFHVEDALYVTPTGEDLLSCKRYVRI